MNIVRLISDNLKSAIKKTGVASLVVSGGSSPIKIFEELSEIDLPWSKVQITLVDDRLVDAKDINSNQKLLLDHLLKKKAKNANFFLLTEDFILNNEFKIPFDVTLLGMGEDGHFASLFPNMIGDYDAFNINAEYKVFKTSSNGDPFLPRITMNLSLILNSEVIILLVKGKMKEYILKQANVEDNVPLHYLLKYRKKNNFFIKKINN